MGIGIIICGLNGAGKSTLGNALAEELGWHFIDIEDLYFPPAGPDYPYASPRARKEVERGLLREIAAHERFVFAAVKGDYGEAVSPSFQYAVLAAAPKEVRMRRVRERSFQKFRERMLPGGDLYEQEERFFDAVRSRAEDAAEEWVRSLSCPILRVDGTRPVKENLAVIVSRLEERRLLCRR